MIAFCTDVEENHPCLLAFRLVLEEHSAEKRDQEKGPSSRKEGYTLVVMTFWADHLLVCLEEVRLAAAPSNSL